MHDPANTQARDGAIVTLPGGHTVMGRFVKVSEMKIRSQPYEKGRLMIYTRIVAGKPIMEAFTLQSLAECLDLSPGKLEGRYHRGRLYNAKVDIPTGQSRPVRGFPMELLKDVRYILEHPGSRYAGAGTSAEGIVDRRPVADASEPLIFEMHGGKKYLTIPNLARHYGRSVTLIRRKLERAGLMRAAVNLSLGLPQGGRPRRGWPEAMYPQLKDAIENGAMYRNELEADYAQFVASHHATPQPHDDDAAIDRQVRELEALMAALPKGQANQLPEGNPDPFAQINALAKPSAVAQAPNPATTPPLQVWIDKLRDPIADCRIWDVDIIKDQMRAAGLSEDDIMDAEYAAERPAPAGSGPDQSAGGAA